MVEDGGGERRVEDWGWKRGGGGDAVRVGGLQEHVCSVRQNGVLASPQASENS